MLVAAIIFPVSSSAQTAEFSVKLIPGKIIENTEGVIEVYSNSDTKTVNKIIATSSDPTIVKILDITQDTTHTLSKIKIKAIKSGDVKIALGAPGFSSTEFLFTVFKNSNMPTKLWIKAVPTSFSMTGPKTGYIGVESANNDGIPTPVTSDMSISVTSSDNKIITPSNNQITIKKGTYYTVGEFIVSQPGTAQISVSSPSMQMVSTSITVNNVDTQNTIQVYVYPSTINSFNPATAYAIVQLHDASGNPVSADEDIPVTIQINDANKTSSTINTSFQSTAFQANEQLVIKKGTYWAYVPIEVAVATSGKFNVGVSAKGNLVSPPVQLTSVIKDVIFDTKTAKMDALPIMASGQRELIGIVHLEDESGNILLSKENLQIHVDSSNPSVVSVSNVQMGLGTQSALVYGQVGTSVNPVTFNVVTDNPQSITPTISKSTSDASSLTVEPLLPKVLTHTTFPLASYLTKNGSLNYITSNFDLLVSPTDAIQTGTISMSKSKPVLLSDAILLKEGLQSFSAISLQYSKTFNVEGAPTNSKSLTLDYPDKLMAGIKNTFSVELIDSQQMPIQADHDMTIKLVSSDPSVITVPESVQIKKGSYFATFDAQSKSDGKSEIAVLADEVTLTKFEANVISIIPEVSLQAADFGAVNVPTSAEFLATYNGVPLKGLKVDWKTSSGTIQTMSQETDVAGKARLVILPTDSGTLHIEASITGGQYKVSSATKDITINPPLSSISPETTSPQSSNISFMGVNPLLFIIPVVAGIGILVFKKKEMFEDMTKKFNFSEIISEMRERVTNQHER